MNFEHSEEVIALVNKREDFMDEHIYPKRDGSIRIRERSRKSMEGMAGERTADAAGQRKRGSEICSFPKEYDDFSLGLTNLEHAPLAEIKIVASRMGEAVIDRAIRSHGGMGMSDDTPLAHVFAAHRSLRIADGPGEVHMAPLGKQKIREYASPGRS